MLVFPLLFQLYALFLAVPYYSKNYASIMCTSLTVGPNINVLTQLSVRKEDKSRKDVNYCILSILVRS